MPPVGGSSGINGDTVGSGDGPGDSGVGIGCRQSLDKIVGRADVDALRELVRGVGDATTDVVGNHEGPDNIVGTARVYSVHWEGFVVVLRLHQESKGDLLHV